MIIRKYTKVKIQITKKAAVITTAAFCIYGDVLISR